VVVHATPLIYHSPFFTALNSLVESWDTPSTPTDLLTALPAKFQEAQQSGQLFFFPSQAKDIYSQGKRASHSPIID
jgi:hypothetical protein